MDAPLYNKIIEYSKAITPFHMPGHKCANIFNIKEVNIFDLDVTELTGLDNLYEAQGVILEAEKKMAVKYGAKESIFLTNGSTAGIIASILALCDPGDSLIVARNCHHSVWNALILGGIHPIYIKPSYHEGYQVLGGICPNELEQVLINHPEAKGVIIVSPTYEGLVSNIQALASVVHQYNKTLIVDEAHGAHFVWDKSFPKSAIGLGADLVIQSMHKTLPSLTQSGLLHICTDRLNKGSLIKSLQMIQTSSPSYVMMGMMDYVRAQMDKESHIWKTYLYNLLKTREKLERLNNLVLLSKDACGHADIYAIDESKIVIYTDKSNISGIELGKILRDQYNIQVEVEAKNYIIAMSTIADRACDLELLSRALFEIDSKIKEKKRDQQYYEIADIHNKDTILPRKIYFGEKEEIAIDQSIGRVSASNIILFPPGIPLICIGEIFSKPVIDRIKELSSQILGIINEKNKIKVSVSKKGENHGR